jgi:hypothetical protein
MIDYKQIIALAKSQLESEMATPILVSLAAVLFLIIVFYTFSPKVKGSKKGKKSGGLSNGVRRSAR